MHVKDLKIAFLPTKIYTVDNKLLCGNAIFSPVKMARLKQREVTKIIDLRNHEKNVVSILKKIEACYCKIFGIKYENLECSICTNSVLSQDFYDKVNRTIIDNNGKVYLHCHYGQHRTSMAIAMYEKFLKKNNEIIVKDLIKNYWKDEEKHKHPKNQKALGIFLDRFFPYSN